ncbi:glycine/betaine ABC transporter substrate-binding protein [Ectothiorhodospira shaposhnikovii]|uniref:choline ABC transporter substrate-binding protein n=1 Tax=Ectothiorhodospira shaposhnikovii TaxID=1054 RepID=UPI0019039940|nr:choline ABC transporter substrate-binding protein [Ectothiorhodospira shaposhnikovii]MBK1672981.1 glycine/betaine ABC transporter substrate-binding protein [Ectothiorhodospira shaposhnikovii]
MHRLLSAITISAMSLTGITHAAEPDECGQVRFAEVGWTDITATTATAQVVLEGMGYDTRSLTVSVPIAYAGLENQDFDVFLGNWMPSMASIIQPYLERGTVETIATNLEGAKYTLAVPRYVHDAGVTHFSDLAEHRRRFGGRIYGIESGNDGNQIIQQMMDDDAYDLGRFRLMESSEAGMLGEVRHNTAREEWIVFLAWEPHPMNTRFDIAYLEGGEDYFGPDFGAATVHTNVRTGYTQQCPNVGRLLSQLSFTLEMENHLMDQIMNRDVDPKVAARVWLQDNSDVLEGWLDGVTTRDGEDAFNAVTQAITAALVE